MWIVDTKITLKFDREVIASAKKFAEAQGMSLSRLTEYLYSQITSENFRSLEDFPISDWVNEVAEGRAEYKTRSDNDKKSEYYKSRKK